MRSYCVFLLVLICVAHETAGQTRPYTFTYPLFPGAGGAGMAYAFTAVADNDMAVFWNPAALALFSRNQLILGGIGTRNLLPSEPNRFQLGLSAILLSWTTRGYGNWALGGYSVQTDSLFPSITLGYGRRFNRFFKAGLALSYQTQFREAGLEINRFRLSLGLLFHVNRRLRFGAVGQTPLATSGTADLAGNQRVSSWKQARIGFLLMPFSFFKLSGDIDAVRGTKHLGVQFQFPHLKVLGGIYGQQLWRKIREKQWNDIRFGFGLVFGNPGLTLAAIQRNRDEWAFVTEVQLNFGRPKVPVRLSQRLMSFPVPTYSGVYLEYEPNPATLVYPQASPCSSHAALSTSNGFQHPTARPAIKQNSEARDSLIALFKQAIQLKPDFWPAYQQAGLHYLEAGLKKNAGFYLSSVVRFYPANNSAILPYSLMLLQGKEWDKALAYLSDGLRLEPENAHLLTGLGLAFLLMNKPDSALYYFAAAGKRTGRLSPALLYYTAFAFAKAGQVEEADSVRTILAKQFPAHPFTRQSDLILDCLKPAPVELAPDSTSIYILKGGMARHVERGTFRISGQDSVFVIANESGEKLYVWLHLANVPAGGTRIIPEWYWKDQLMFRGSRGLRVGRSGRTFGYKTIWPHQTGRWSVKFYLKESGAYIGAVSFEIKGEE